MIYSHLDVLSSHFEKYLPENVTEYNCIRNPFVGNSQLEFSTLETDQFIDLSSIFTVAFYNISNNRTFGSSSILIFKIEAT